MCTKVILLVQYLFDLLKNFKDEIQIKMENLGEINVHPFRRSGWVSTIDFESKLVEELQQERLRQSRIIANQLDVIGKLRHALERMMCDRSSRMSTIQLFSMEKRPSVFRQDAYVQTSYSGPDEEAIKNALSFLYAENQELYIRQKESEDALRTEREKTKRVLRVCSRISTARSSAISSPAFAKWVSLGLEEATVSTRNRTESFDDSLLLKLPRLYGEDSCTTRSRSAFSEGDSPKAGFDLDMVYGMNFETPSALVPHDAVPMTPRAGSVMSPLDADEVCRLEGLYWTGDSVGWIQRVSAGYLECSLLEGGCIIPQEVTDTGITFLTSANERTMRGVYCKEKKKISWDNWIEWKRMEELSQLLVGEWWTGFAIVKLKATRGGTWSGRWGQMDIKISPTSFIADQTGHVKLESVGSPPVCNMRGSIEPRYLPAGPLVASCIHWDNGMRWEQISSSSSIQH